MTVDSLREGGEQCCQSFFCPRSSTGPLLTWIFPLGSILNWVRFTIYCDLDWLRLFEPEPGKKGGPCWLWVEVRKWLIKESGSMRVPPEVVISGLARRVSVDSLWGKPCQPWIPLLVPLATSPFYHLPFCCWWNNNECSHFLFKMKNNLAFWWESVNIQCSL